MTRLSLNKSFFFFFNDTATTEIYTLSLHDALPISLRRELRHRAHAGECQTGRSHHRGTSDRKSTRLNSSHANISYAVFCLKKKKTIHTRLQPGSPQWCASCCHALSARQHATPLTSH